MYNFKNSFTFGAYNNNTFIVHIYVCMFIQIFKFELQRAYNRNIIFYVFVCTYV